MSRIDEWPTEAETIRWRTGIAETYYRLLKEYAQQAGIADHQLMAAKIEKAEHDLYKVVQKHNETRKITPG